MEKLESRLTSSPQGISSSLEKHPQFPASPLDSKYVKDYFLNSNSIF